MQGGVQHASFWVVLRRRKVHARLPLLGEHGEVDGQPADEARVELAELLQVERAQPRVQLAPDEEVVHAVAWRTVQIWTPQKGSYAGNPMPS